MRKLIVAAMLCLYAGALHGQGPNATVSGRVTDPSDAIIVQAKVTLINQGTNIHYVGTTNASGNYVVPELPAGTYRVEAQASGFKSVIKPGVVLHVQDVVKLDFEMTVGSLDETVTVVGGAPAIELASSSISGTVDQAAVVGLPLNGRDWTQLATLQPGVNAVLTQQPNGVAASRAVRGFGNQIAISGTRPQLNNYQLDGISIVDYAGGAPGSTLGVALGVDAIAEFSVLTANYSADYGRTSGGVITAVTKSGTNQFHGDAYEFLRNSALDAKNYFDQGAIPPFKRNQFGASLGGPIQRNKTFFFVDYEGFRQSLGTTTINNVPSQDARNGILHNSDGSTTTVSVDPLVKPFLPFWPLPNAGLIGTGDTGHYDIALNSTSIENFVTAKLDRKFSDKDSASGSYFYDSSSASAPDNLNTVLRGNVGNRQMVALQETHVFAPSLLNTFRGGFSRITNTSADTLETINPLAGDPSLGSFPGRDAPQISVTGLSSFSGGNGALSTIQFVWNSFQAYDDGFWTKGLHSLKFGFAAERMQFNFLVPSRPNGVFTFGSLVGFLTNQPLTFVGSVPGSFSEFGDRQSLFGGFIQDDWHIRPNLTLNLGLRYEVVTVPTEAHGKLVNLASFTSPPPGHLGSPYFQNPTLHDFEPRVGFSWDPYHTGKTAIRGAYGIFDALPLIYEFFLMQTHSAPFVEQISGGNLPAGSFPTEAASLSNVIPSKLVSNSIQNNPSRNYVMIWNLNVQQELSRTTTLSVSYVGNHGIHMVNREDDVNSVLPVTSTSNGLLFPFPAGSGTRLNPAVGDISGLYWNGDSKYDALNVQLTKQISHGVQGAVSYSWGKTLDTGSASVAGDPFQNSISSPFYFCRTCRYGPADFNVGQTLVVNYLWQIPSSSNFGVVASHVLGGWELGGIFTAESGLPISPRIGGDPLGLGSTDPTDFPIRIRNSGCGSLTNSGSVNNYINLNCFSLPPVPAANAAQCTPFAAAPGTCANLLNTAGSRNILVGPGVQTFDVSLLKNNYIKGISEAFNIQFRAELFNSLNRPNFSTPVDNQTLFDQNGSLVAGAGSLDQTSTTSREIQFALKVIW